MKTNLLLILLSFFCVNFLISQTTVIPFGGTWKYKDDGSDQGTAWQAPGFNDATWSSGSAQLGFGDSDEATVVTGGFVTYYFRTSFNLTSTSGIGGLDLDLLYDDAAIIYLNGTEVERVNMPSGTVNYLTSASGNLGDNLTYNSTSISPSLLVTGNNVVAVEIHNNGAGSSDISFDLKLQTTGVPPPSTNLVDYGDGWKYKDDGSNQGTAWVGTSFNDASWSSGNAQLGFGDSDEATVVTGGHITYYFRRTINVASLAGINSLDIDFLHDDGGVIYINGVEVMRENMPSGTITHTTTANGSSGDNNVVSQNVPATGLVVGNNVIAVEVHNSSAGSSDISFDLEIKPNSSVAPPASLERGPYLQMGTPNSMIVKWRTDNNKTGRVIYGTTWNSLNLVANEVANTTDHEVQLTGLLPYTKYYYAIGSQTDTLFGYGDSTNYFYTSPPVGDKSKKRIWVLGDAGTANSNQRNVRDAYYNHHNNYTDLILQLGDNAYSDGTDSEYQDAMFENMYEDILRKTVVWSTIGNHDSRSTNITSGTGVYFDIYTFPKNAEAGGVASGVENYYSFDYGNIHFMVLSSEEYNLDSTDAMLIWAKQDIQNTTQDWIVGLWHHPPYSKGSHDSDGSGTETDMREQALPILEKYGLDLVLNGHSHSYERSMLINGHYDVSSTLTPSMILDNTSGKHSVDCAYQKTTTGPDAGKGAVYIVTGSAGKKSSGSLDHAAMYYSVSELGSTFIEVEGNRMDIKFIDDNGNVDDELSIMKDVPKVVDTVVPAGSVINLDASWEGGNYNWSVGGSTTKTLAYTAPSTNTTITVTDGYGCLTDTFNIMINGSVGLESLTKENTIKVFPNPASVNDQIVVTYDQTLTIEDSFLVNALGQTVNVNIKNNGSGQLSFSTSTLSKGTYNVFVLADGKTYKESLVIK